MTENDDNEPNLSEETLRDIEVSKEQLERGETIPLSEVMDDVYSGAVPVEELEELVDKWWKDPLKTQEECADELQEVIDEYE